MTTSLELSKALKTPIQYKCYVGKACVNADYPQMEQDLIQLGLEGWEFCYCYNGNLFIFKK